MTDRYRWGRYEVLAGERRVLDAGRPVVLGARAFDVLWCLVERRDRVVSKDELMALVWPGTVVEENNLTVQISAVRKLLGPDTIATVPGRGYRFTPAESDLDNGAKPASSAGPTQPELSLPDRPSIAVLPFENLSGEPTQDVFCDGITEEIITELSRFRSLFVIARNSSFTYKALAVDVRTVARELGVRYVLEGSIRRAGERVRVTAQLIDALSGNHIWAEKYDRVLEDIFAVQEEVTQAIVAAVAPHVETSEAGKTRRRQPDIFGAYELAVRAWESLRHTNGENGPARDEALQLARKAAELDPRSALAWRGIAYVAFQNVYLQAYSTTEKAIREGIAAANTAVSLDPIDHAAHLYKGILLYLLGQHEQGLSDMRRARELNPNDASTLTLLGFCEALCGDATTGLRYTTEALRLSPRDPNRALLLNCLGWVQLAAGNYDQAFDAAQKAVGENPDLAPARLCLAVSCAARGDVARARQEFALVRAAAPELADSRVAGMWMGNDGDYHRRATKFARIAAGLEDA